MDGCTSTTVRVNGNVYDSLGFPVEGASISFVTGYSLKADDGLHISKTLAGPVSSNTTGAFSISFSNPKTDLAFRVNYQNEVARITAKQVTGTSVPFYNAEVWSPDSTKWINDLNNEGLLSNLAIYIDPSRTNIWNYFLRTHPDLINSLQNHPDPDNGQSAWEGDHRNPDNPTHECSNDGCDDHYDYPQVLDRPRKINPPWGSQRGVIPFVCAEGIVFNKEISLAAADDDRNWDIILEPQYAYLPNKDNQNLSADHEPRTGKEYALHCEMCSWFMDKKGGTRPPASVTNISRDDNLLSFITKRVWMVGTWTVDNGHHDGWGNTIEYHNEIHPIYWIVPFIGGWRRFYASEIIRISSNTTGAKEIIAEMHASSPQSLLQILSSTLALAMSFKSRPDAEKFYMESIVHLNKFGLNSAFPNGANDAANSITKADFQQEASTLSVSQMTDNIKKRYNLIFNHLTTLGSGVFIFPSMIFIYEGTDIIQEADALGLHHPNSLITVFDPRIQVSLGKEVMAFGDSVVENGSLLLKLAYQDLFNQMKTSAQITAAQMADYYALSSVRLINYGMYENNNPQHSPNYQDHYNWALPRAKTDTIALTDSINVRIDHLWNDAFPFARIGETKTS